VSWQRRVFVLGLFALCTPKLACTPGQLGGTPQIWPERAYLGGTITVPVDTNSMVLFPLLETFEQGNLSIDNVWLRLNDADGVPVDLIPRAVITTGPGPSAESGAVLPGATVTIAVLDLPRTDDTRGNFDFPSYPFDTTISIIWGLDPPFIPSSTLRILGPHNDIEAKGPRDFLPFYGSVLPTEGLAPRPALRLRAHGVTDCVPPSLTFPGGTIGGVQFEIEYPTARVTQPDPIPASQAARATATASVLSTGATERARIVLIAPDGFTQPDAIGCRRGTGPFLDIAFTKLDTFDEGHFTIYDLYVTGVDGTPVLDERGNDSTAYFELIPRSNF